MKRYTKEDLLKQLFIGQLNESETVEFKKQWRQNNGRSLSAIGNGEERGWMIIGVDDNGCLINKDIQWAREQRHQIENHIIEYLNPSATVQSISIESFEEKQFIVIEIITPTSIVSWNQKYYKRNGHLLGLSDSKSEQVQVSRLFQQWEKENFVEKGRKKGVWRIKEQFDDEYASLLEYLRNYRIIR